jgi:DNA-binding beta-propeller fold protein YncE
MPTHRRSLATAVAAALLVSNCGGNGNQGPSVSEATKDVAVPGITAGSTFSFDLGTVANGKYYVTDRNNRAVDVIDLATLTLTRITGTGADAFTGCRPNASCVGADNSISGPDGINAIPGTTLLYVGDVDNVRVVDTAGNTVVRSITVGTSGKRADEGCYDADHHLYMISTPEADIPFATFISTDTQTVIATVQFTDPQGGASAVAAGLEQCRYDPGTQSFLVNNDGTAANPHGEVDVLPVASIASQPRGATVTAFSLANVKRFALGNCDPTGMDLGPGSDMAVECRQGDKGAALTTLILDRSDGTILETVPFGGGDQLAYDARSNRYYVAGSRWHASGVNDLGGGCSAANPCTPYLGIIDAGTRKLLDVIFTGNNAHSVAVDPATGRVFVPYSSATAPGGCASCAERGFINGGISVFTPS